MPTPLIQVNARAALIKKLSRLPRHRRNSVWKQCQLKRQLQESEWGKPVDRRLHGCRQPPAGHR